MLRTAIRQVIRPEVPTEPGPWMMEIDLTPAFSEHLLGEMEALFEDAPETDADAQG